MTHALTWQYLSPEDVHRCLGADGPDALYRALIAADADNSDEHKLLKTLFTEVPQKVGLSPTPEGVGPAAGPSPPSSHPQQQHRNSTHGALYVQPYAAQQQQVALDLFFHLILKCREHQLTPEKTSAAVGIVARTHSESMRRVLSLEASYALFGQLLQLHAVHRPPFAAAVLTIEDAKVLTDFFLGTYYRHYKLYLYAFTPRRVATVRAFTLAEGAHDVPPLVPPQSAAVPLAAFEAARDEVAAAASAKAAAAAREEKAREDAERQRVEEEAARIPPIPSGLQAQLSAIRSGVVGLSVGKLSSLEAKLDAIEARIAASQQSAAAQQQPLGATAGRKGAAVSGSPKRSPTRAQGFEPAPRRPSPPAAPSSGPPSVHYSLGGYAAPSLALPSKGTVGSGGSPRLPLSSSSPFSSPYGGAVGGSNSAAAPHHHHQSLEYLQRYKSFGTAEYRTAFGITALAEAILHRVLSELPERPLQLMAAVCKEWSDAAFVEAEALYGEAAAAAGRSTSPGAAPSPYAALNAVLGDGMKGSSSGANNNSLSSPSQQQRARSTSAGGSPIHIVGGRPSQPRAPSITAVTPDGGVAIAHPPVLPWVRARPAVPPSLINIGGVGGGGGGGGLTSAGSTSSTSGGRYSASAYGGGGGGGLRVRSPSSAGGSRGLAAARGGLAVGSTAAAPIAPYWAVAGSGGSGLSGGALKSNSGGGGESAEVLRQRRLAGALGAPSSSSPQPTAAGGTSGGGNGSAFTYACRDYVQRHRVACIIDDWLFAITAQKPYSPALFSHNYFRQRHRMRHAVRREAALGTQLTTEEKERARVAALRRRASAASAAAGEKGDANSKQSPLSDDSDDAKEGGAADDAVPQLSRRASTRSATGGGGSGVWPSSPAAANKGGAAAGGGDGYGLEATSHVVAAAAVRRPTDTDGATTPTLNGAGASRGGDVPTASLMYANAQPKRAPLAFATAAPKAAEPAAVGANSGASPASPASPLGPTPGPSDGIWPSTPNALNNTPMPIGEGIPANVVTFSRPDPSAFESTSAAAAMLPGDGGGATAPPSVDMLAGGYAAVSPITPAPSAIPLAPTQGGEEFGDDIVSARSSPGAALDSAAVAPLSMASGAWGADVGPS